MLTHCCLAFPAPSHGCAYVACTCLLKLNYACSCACTHAGVHTRMGARALLERAAATDAASSSMTNTMQRRYRQEDRCSIQPITHVGTHHSVTRDQHPLITFWQCQGQRAGFSLLYLIVLFMTWLSRDCGMLACRICIADHALCKVMLLGQSTLACGRPCNDCLCRLPSAVGSRKLQYSALWSPQPSLKRGIKGLVHQPVQNALQEKAGNQNTLCFLQRHRGM